MKSAEPSPSYIDACNTAYLTQDRRKEGVNVSDVIGQLGGESINRSNRSRWRELAEELIHTPIEVTGLDFCPLEHVIEPILHYLVEPGAPVLAIPHHDTYSSAHGRQPVIVSRAMHGHAWTRA